MALSTQTPLVRYLESPHPYRPLHIDLPLRMLGTISAPGDCPLLDAPAEQDKVETALRSPIEEGLIRVHWLTDLSLRALQRELDRAQRAGQPYHVWHHIGHGAWDERAGAGTLLLCGPDGRSQAVGGFELGALFGDHPSLRLALLNACEGARSDRQDALGSVAAALVERRVPAVIGMQFEISDQAALAFAEGFYEALVDGAPVDVAVTGGRRAVFSLPNWVEWATPVLYMRAADGVYLLNNLGTLCGNP
ncbi:MAG: CHAT domain-containing protein [Anaerolineae bacterium]|nr:CHAT domain-containing protein [Anaerolineae bacterium]